MYALDQYSVPSLSYASVLSAPSVDPHSQERLTSNGSVAPAADDADRAAEIENHNQGQPVLSGESHPEEDSVEGSTSVTDLGRPVEEAVGLEGRGEGDVVTEERPPRPISPLGEGMCAGMFSYRDDLTTPCASFCGLWCAV